MGAYLSKPVKEKLHEVGENNSIRFASCTMQGWRVHQEDAHNCILDFEPGVGFYAVYDGHGGSDVSQYLADNFPEFLKQKKLLEKNDIEASLKKAFVEFDATLRTDGTVKLMNALKESDVPKKTEETQDTEEAERKEREALYDEAVALSMEANISLDKIIMEYAKCRNFLIEKEEMRGSKRPVVTPSPQLSKRRKIHRADATESNDENQAENNAASNGEVVTEGGKNSSDAELEVSGKTARIEKDTLKDNLPSGNGKVKEQIDEPNSINNNDNSEGKNEVPQKTTDSSASSAEAEKKLTTDSSSERQQTSSDQELKTEEQVASSTSTLGNSEGLKALMSEEADDDENDSDYKVEEDEDVENEDDDDEDEETDKENGAEDADDAEEDEDDEEEDEEEEELDEEDIGHILERAETGGKAGFDSGSTACVAFIFKDRIVVANIGDSRAVLCRDGKAVDLSTDHKPEDETEKKRIVDAGGHVGEDGRVNGGLNLSRAFGDHYYKQKEELPLHEQMITAKPDVTITERDAQKDEYLILACDGIWNQMSSEELCNYVSERINTMGLEELTAEICEHCCAPDTTGDGSGCDNETVILIDLKKGERNNIKMISTKQSTEPLAATATNTTTEKMEIETNSNNNIDIPKKENPSVMKTAPSEQPANADEVVPRSEQEKETAQQ